MNESSKGSENTRGKKRTRLSLRREDDNDYDSMRMRNIERNEAMLESLGLLDKDERNMPPKKGKNQKAKRVRR